jgi:hypothetical protein
LKCTAAKYTFNPKPAKAPCLPSRYPLQEKDKGKMSDTRC